MKVNWTQKTRTSECREFVVYGKHDACAGAYFSLFRDMGYPHGHESCLCAGLQQLNASCGSNNRQIPRDEIVSEVRICIKKERTNTL